MITEPIVLARSYRKIVVCARERASFDLLRSFRLACRKWRRWLSGVRDETKFQRTDPKRRAADHPILETATQSMDTPAYCGTRPLCCSRIAFEPGVREP
jgi:hypothetical protein